MAEVLSLFADDPKRLDTTAGLAFDLVRGEVLLAEGLGAALKRSEEDDEREDKIVTGTHA